MPIIIRRESQCITMTCSDYKNLVVSALNAALTIIKALSIYTEIKPYVDEVILLTSTAITEVQMAQFAQARFTITKIKSIINVFSSMRLPDPFANMLIANLAKLINGTQQNGIDTLVVKCKLRTSPTEFDHLYSPRRMYALTNRDQIVATSINQEPIGNIRQPALTFDEWFAEQSNSLSENTDAYINFKELFEQFFNDKTLQDDVEWREKHYGIHHHQAALFTMISQGLFDLMDCWINLTHEERTEMATTPFDHYRQADMPMDFITSMCMECCNHGRGLLCWLAISRVMLHDFLHERTASFGNMCFKLHPMVLNEPECVKEINNNPGYFLTQPLNEEMVIALTSTTGVQLTTN
nr:MAG: hypothetical protein [Wufeng shrew picorna-like virus 26]